MCDYLKCIKIFFIYNLMEENDIQNNNQIKIKVSELVKKFRTKKIYTTFVEKTVRLLIFIFRYIFPR